jgi:hypothetical protein
MSILDYKARHDAEQSVNYGAKAGHHLHTAVTLIADLLGDSTSRIPGGGWMITVLWHHADDENQPTSVVSYPVLFFDDETGIPEFPMSDGDLTRGTKITDPFCVWHPQQVDDEGCWTHERAARALKAGEDR